MKLEKITDDEAGQRRRYDDACGAAHALELAGERWALLVIRELMLGPRRFSDIRAELTGLSANVLTQRLEGLESAGILIRRRLPPPSGAQVYELTPWGYEAEPIFQTLGRWAARSPQHDPTRPFSAASLFLSFRTMFDPARAEGAQAAIGFRIGAEAYEARVAGAEVTVRRGEPDGPAVIFEGKARTIAAAVYGAVPLAALEQAGDLHVSGDRALAERFVTWFPLPPKA